jgi:hypothetical protein
MAAFDDLLAPHTLETIRRGLVLEPEKPPAIGRDRVLALIEELERLRHEQAQVAGELRGLLNRLEARQRHPSG